MVPHSSHRTPQKAVRSILWLVAWQQSRVLPLPSSWTSSSRVTTSVGSYTWLGTGQLRHGVPEQCLQCQCRGWGSDKSRKTHYLFTLEKFPTEAPLTQELKAKANTDCQSPPPPKPHTNLRCVALHPFLKLSRFCFCNAVNSERTRCLN